VSLEKPEDKSTYFLDEKHIKSDIDAMEDVTATAEKGKRKSGMFS